MTNNISVSIRPEKIIINTNSISNSLKGKVITSSFVGTSYQYTLSTPIGNLNVVSTDTSNFTTFQSTPIAPQTMTKPKTQYNSTYAA